jgi:zinc transport system substrate-binding protein
VLLGLAQATAAACQPATVLPTPDALPVTVSILPQRYFVERIGGDGVSVGVLVPPGASPATYEPKPEQLRALSRSAAYFRIRVPFEDAWMARIASANPSLRVVDTTQGIDWLHTAGGRDPHIWLSPRLVVVQAQTITGALAELDPPGAPVYQANLARFRADIDHLDGQIRRSLSGLEQRSFMVLHPSWGYFARDYELTMFAVEVGGQEPSAAELTALIARARAEGIRVVFAQPQFSTRAARTIAHEIGGEVVLIDPLAADWLDNLRTVAATFARVLGASVGP